MTNDIRITLSKMAAFFMLSLPLLIFATLVYLAPSKYVDPTTSTIESILFPRVPHAKTLKSVLHRP